MNSRNKYRWLRVRWDGGDGMVQVFGMSSTTPSTPVHVYPHPTPCSPTLSPDLPTPPLSSHPIPWSSHPTPALFYLSVLLTTWSPCRCSGMSPTLYPSPFRPNHSPPSPLLSSCIPSVPALLATCSPNRCYRLSPAPSTRPTRPSDLRLSALPYYLCVLVATCSP